MRVCAYTVRVEPFCSVFRWALERHVARGKPELVIVDLAPDSKTARKRAQAARKRLMKGVRK
jgi:hypothetical protein